MNDGTTHLIFTKALHPSITDWLASDRLEVENSNTSELKEFAGFWYVRISKKQLILTL